MERFPINTAPRDGRPVILHAEYATPMEWVWDAQRERWGTSDGLIWREDGDFAPTSWSVAEDTIFEC